MAIDTTVGGASANSFASIAELDAYEAARLPRITGYSAFTDPDKEAILIAGRRELEACFDWTGSAVDAVQVLTWPRAGMMNRNGYAVLTTVNPIELKDAQCEFGLQLKITNRLGDNDPLRKGITSLKAGPVALSFSDVQGGAGNNIEGADVAIRKMQSDLNYVSLVVPDEVRRLIPALWFKQRSVKRPLVFQVFPGC